MVYKAFCLSVVVVVVAVRVNNQWHSQLCHACHVFCLFVVVGVRVNNVLLLG